MSTNRVPISTDSRKSNSRTCEAVIETLRHLGVGRAASRAIVLFGVFGACACGSGHTSAARTVSGEGSSFDAPLFSSVFGAYGSEHHVDVSYQPLGSGDGQTALNDGTVDFGAFDVPMLVSDHFSNFSKIVQFPVALGGETVIYNLPDYHGRLRLTGAVLARVYGGEINRWSDPQLVALNPRLASLRGTSEDAITVIHRSDSSGSSYIFTDFMSHTSPTWKSAFGASKLPAWPVGVGAAKNTGVDAEVNSTVGSVGYVESAYAIQNPHAGVGSASIKNRSGRFLQPTIAGISADAVQVSHISTTHFSVVFATGRSSYPITGYSWAGVYRTVSNWHSGPSVCRDTVALFKWETSSGQKYGPALDYPVMPSQIQHYAKRQLDVVHC